MKRAGYNCELIGEYAKDCVWKDRTSTLKDQIYMFGKQHNRLFHLQHKVDYIVTDSPLFMLLFYGDSVGGCYKQFVMETFNKYHNVNFFITRTKPYNPAGRYQTADESDEIGIQIRGLMLNEGIAFRDITSDTTADEILTFIEVCCDHDLH
jgi:hypothetical protein